MDIKFCVCDVISVLVGHHNGLGHRCLGIVKVFHSVDYFSRSIYSRVSHIRVHLVLHWVHGVQFIPEICLDIDSLAYHYRWVSRFDRRGCLVSLRPVNCGIGGPPTNGMGILPLGI